ncbi:MAG: alpha/beta fold hydrolase [Nocardioidaceae bacterium]
MTARTTGFVHSDGDSVFYETVGEGEPVVFCHGLGGNGGIWFQQVPAFARDYQVVVWDQRGFGRSTDHHARTGPRTAVSDLEKILDHLGIEAAHLVGQSMGGWAALGVALRSRQRVRSLVFSATTGGIDLGKPRGAFVRDHPGARPLGEHPALGSGFSVGSPALAYLYQVLGSFGVERSEAAISASLAAVTHAPEELTGLDRPVLFLAGEHDELYPPATLRACAALLPDARVVEVKGVGHSPYFEHPAVWNKEVHDFLARARRP